MTDAEFCLHRLQRAVASSHQLWRLEKSRLKQIEIDLAEVRDSERKAIELLGAARIAPELMERQLVMLACRSTELRAARAAQKARAMQFGRQAKLLETLVGQKEIALRRATSVAELRRLAGLPSVRAPQV
ncbi:MAG: hypothetical protein CTY15_05195 [Methylocystis sp.]|nr:MAG: hypothetical protein CTY15_05195 [Methylocystis sp.]